MPKTQSVRARIDPKLKNEVTKLLDKMGLTTSEAITIFFQQIKLRKGLPFNVVIPNETTEFVFKDTDLKKNLVRCEDEDALFEKLGI